MNYDERAKMLINSTCVEEYIVNRDLKWPLSWLERVLDPIAFLEKHSVVKSWLSNSNDSNVPMCMLLFMFSFSIPFALTMRMMFSDASHDAVLACFICSLIGTGCIAFSFFIRLLDGFFALKFMKNIASWQ